MNIVSPNIVVAMHGPRKAGSQLIKLLIPMPLSIGRGAFEIHTLSIESLSDFVGFPSSVNAAAACAAPTPRILFGMSSRCRGVPGLLTSSA